MEGKEAGSRGKAVLSADAVHPQIEEASTLPGTFYGDPNAYAATLERVFARSWQLVGDAHSVRVPGQVHPFTLLEGALDEPLLLTRDHDDKLHCISNVCTHRANLIVEEGGVHKQLRCRYHGRRFGLDGCFQFMPECDKAKGFPSESDSLPKVALEQWGPLLFANLDPAFEFERWIAPVKERVGWLPIHEFRLEPTRCKEYIVQAHWALYCDNYLEGFHIPYIHAGLTAALDYSSYKTEVFDLCNLQLGVGKDDDVVFDLPKSSPDHGKSIAAYYFWMFPNLMLNFYPWGLNVNVIKPLGPNRTRVSFVCYVWDESKLDQGAGSSLDRVEREDEAVVELVQRGVRSRLYKRGRFSPTQELGTHHFHRLLARHLS